MPARKPAGRAPGRAPDRGEREQDERDRPEFRADDAQASHDGEEAREYGRDAQPREDREDARRGGEGRNSDDAGREGEREGPGCRRSAQPSGRARGSSRSTRPHGGARHSSSRRDERQCDPERRVDGAGGRERDGGEQTARTGEDPPDGCRRRVILITPSLADAGRALDALGQVDEGEHGTVGEIRGSAIGRHLDSPGPTRSRRPLPARCRGSARHQRA